MSVPIDHRSGTQLGPFLLGNAVGQGGMGVVYRATNLEAGEEVALKLMSPELSSSEEFRQRFLNEAAVGPIMDHPNVVPIYGSGEAEGELYIAMKLIEGRNLKEVLKEEGPLDPKRALRIFRQVASALDAAHESGMVHRDIKPQNILLATDDGQHDLAYVSDFGLVKPISSDTSASRTGQVFGSLPYMAPEQIEAMEMDGRADVYALACVVFESLTGKPPFERPNEVAVVWAHVHEEPPFVTEVNRDLPGGIDGVVMQAMSKHPDDRFLTCGEFIEAFEQGLGRQRSRVSRAMRPLVARTERPKTAREVWGPNFFPELSRIRKVERKVNWFKVGAFVTALFLIASIQVGREGGIPTAVEDVAHSVGEIGRDFLGPPEPDQARQSRTSDPERQTSSDLSSSLASRTKSDGELKVLTDSGSRDSAPSTSGSATGGSPPHDTWIIFSSQRDDAGNDLGDLFMMRPDGTEVTRLTDSPAAIQDTDASLSPDLSRVAFVSNRGGNWDIYVMDIDGSNLRQLTNTPEDCDFEPHWSPDGTKILYQDSCDFTMGGQDIWIVNPDGTGRRPFIHGPGYQGGPAWSPDGSKIVYDGGTGLYIARADGRVLRHIPGTVADDYSPYWCTNGKIYFTSFTETGGPNDIFVINPDGTGRRRLTASEGRDQWPSCSPDSSKVVFKSTRDGHSQIYVMDADGSGQRNISRSTYAEHDPEWQPRSSS